MLLLILLVPNLFLFIALPIFEPIVAVFFSWAERIQRFFICLFFFAKNNGGCFYSVKNIHYLLSHVMNLSRWQIEMAEFPRTFFQWIFRHIENTVPIFFLAKHEVRLMMPSMLTDPLAPHLGLHDKVLIKIQHLNIRQTNGILTLWYPICPLTKCHTVTIWKLVI